MAFGEPIRAKCEQNVSSHCASKNGEIVLIYNKSRMACQYCNEQIKQGEREERKKRGTQAREIAGELIQKVVTGGRAFGKLAAMDSLFYKKMWDKNANWRGACLCEECGKVLFPYSSMYVSHIISRGAETRLRYDDRNINILCFEHHQQWETGDRSKMNIYSRNQETIEVLKSSLIK